MYQKCSLKFREDSHFGRVLIMSCVILALVLSSTQLIAKEREYIIGEGDTLNISVWGNKDVSLSAKVRPDGKITVPVAGDIHAAGMTVSQLKMILQTVLRDYIKNPTVTVIVEEITNNKVYVTGGGVPSGVFELNKKTTLLQLLCRIGGAGQAEPGAGNQVLMLENADLRKAYIIRGNRKFRKDFHALFYEGNITQDVDLEINDIIFIPPPADRNIYVVGAVNTPKNIVYREGLTVMEAVLDAGGFTKFAKPNGTIIIRKDGNREQMIPSKLNDLIKDGDMSQNVRLKPGDYVVVKEGVF